MILKKVFFIFLVASTIACSSEDKVIIKPFVVLNRVDTIRSNGKVSINKADYFLINHYYESKNSQKYIDSFMFSHKDINFKKYGQYSMLLYRQSEKTNLTGNPYDTNVIDKYSNQEDLLFEYIWYQGRFALKNKFKDAQFIRRTIRLTSKISSSMLDNPAVYNVHALSYF